MPGSRLLLALTVPPLAFALACGSDGAGPSAPAGLPACGAATLFTVSPIADANIREVAPLGNLNPSGHVFPTDHIYLYPPGNASGTNLVPVVSPGTIRIGSVNVQKRMTPGAAEFDDYGMTFYLCATQEFYFGHLSSLSADLQARVGTLGGGCNAPYQTGNSTFQQCYKSVNITLNAGDAIGTAGGPQEGALDLGAIDHAQAPLAYVDAGRQTGAGGLYTACPLDYFAPAAQSALLARVAVNGTPRTTPPICGTVMQDVANTAQGRWFFDATAQEDHHLALVHASVNPAIGAFSIGTSIPGVSPTVLSFSPAQSGRVNLDFDRVTADGNIYCYQQFTFAPGTLYIRLATNSRLRVQLGPNATCGDPSTWSFGATAVTFDR